MGSFGGGPAGLGGETRGGGFGGGFAGGFSGIGESRSPSFGSFRGTSAPTQGGAGAISGFARNMLTPQRITGSILGRLAAMALGLTGPIGLLAGGAMGFGIGSALGNIDFGRTGGFGPSAGPDFGREGAISPDRGQGRGPVFASGVRPSGAMTPNLRAIAEILRQQRIDARSGR